MTSKHLITAHFTLDEFACRDGTAVPPELHPNVLRLAQQLEVLRAYLGAQPIRILSGYRTAAHNASLRGAAKRSRHLTAEAADIVIAGVPPRAIHAEIERLIAAGLMQEGGLGLYPYWVHYDIRGRRARWGMPSAGWSAQ
jgi:uncharacterized protein YcbK (DUF882 family)